MNTSKEFILFLHCFENWDYSAIAVACNYIIHKLFKLHTPKDTSMYITPLFASYCSGIRTRIARFNVESKIIFNNIWFYEGAPKNLFKRRIQARIGRSEWKRVLQLECFVGVWYSFLKSEFILDLVEYHWSSIMNPEGSSKCCPSWCNEVIDLAIVG